MEPYGGKFNIVKSLVSLKLYYQLIIGLLCRMSPPLLSHMRTTANHSGACHGTWHVPSDGVSETPFRPNNIITAGPIVSKFGECLGYS